MDNDIKVSVLTDEDVFSESPEDLKVENNLIYAEGKNSIKIMGYADNETSLDKLEIPRQIAGKNVTIINCRCTLNNREPSPECKLIVIPDTVSKLENLIEYEEKWFFDIEVDKNNPYLKAENGVLFSKDGKNLIFSFWRDIKKFIVPDGVEEICDNAFSEMKIEEVLFPDSLKKIGKRAFKGTFSCPIKKAVIPKGTEYIGDEAFSEDTEITITGNNTKIGTKIGGNIIIAEGCSAYIVENGLLMDSEKTRIIKYMGDRKITEIAIPESIKIIDDYAFAHLRDLKKIELNDGLKKIGEHAFFCTNIRSVTIPNTVEALAVNSFSEDRPKTRVMFKKGMKYYREDEEALYRCYDDGTEELIKIKDKDIEKFTVSENLVKFRKGVFGDCSRLKELILSEKTERFDEECICSYSYGEICGITRVYIPASVKTINMNSYSGNIKYVISEENPYYFVDDDTIYKVNADDDYTLLRCQNPNICRTEIIDGTTSVAPYAFSGFSAYDNNNCSLLKEVIFPDSLKTIGEFAFAETGLERIVFPPELKSVWEGAFTDCGSLEYVSISAKTSWIAYNAFKGCNSLKDIAVSKDNMQYKSENGVLFNYDMNRLTAYPNGRNEEKYSIPDGVGYFGKAFSKITSLDTLIIPASVKNITNWAFAVSNIQNLIFKGDIEKAGDFIFADMLKHPVFVHADPDSLIFKACQNDCNALAVSEGDSPEVIQTKKDFGYIIKDGKAVIVKYKGNDRKAELPAAIEGCPVEALKGNIFLENLKFSLQELIIPEGVKRLEEGALCQVGTYTLISFPASLEYIDENVFKDKTGFFGGGDLGISHYITVVRVHKGNCAQEFFSKYRVFSKYRDESGEVLKMEII